MLADGSGALRGITVLRDQRDVFGPVASTTTSRRVPAAIDTAPLPVLRAASAGTREIAWLQAGTTGHPKPALP